MRLFLWLAIGVTALLQSACTPYTRDALSMQAWLQAGDIQAASRVAEHIDPHEKDVLASLNKGMLRRMLQKYEASNRIFETAKRKMEQLYGVSISEQFGAVTINDTLRQYQGSRYEQLLLHAYMAMNYLELGETDAARVEMLQADIRMREWAGQHDDPFVRYLSAIIFESLGEPDQALVAYRKAVDGYLQAADSQPLAVPRQLKYDLLRLLASEGLRDELQTMLQRFHMDASELPQQQPDEGEVIVLLHNGLAPVRTETAMFTFAYEIEDRVRIALPAYRQPRPVLPAARVTATVGGSRMLETVEDIDALARDALQQEMPAIMARAIARAVIKYKTQHRAREQGGDLAGFFATIANLVTERADTRSWTTLPAQIQLARLSLPAGRHRLRLELLNRAQQVIDRIDHDVEVLPGSMVLLSRHWIAPSGHDDHLH